MGVLVYELRAVHCRVDESPVRWRLGGLCSCTGGEASSSSRLGLWNTSSPLGVIDFFLADEKIANMRAEGLPLQRRGLVAMPVAMPTSPVTSSVAAPSMAPIHTSLCKVPLQTQVH
jgi:hypothetical protein